LVERHNAERTIKIVAHKRDGRLGYSLRFNEIKTTFVLATHKVIEHSELWFAFSSMLLYARFAPRAFEPKVDLFDGGGPGAHLSERTVQQLQYAYGKFLYFISAERDHLLKRAPARRLNAKIIEEYVNWQPQTCGKVTLSLYLYHLWLALRYLCPRDDWRWLLVISRRFKAQAKPKPEKHHLRHDSAAYKDHHHPPSTSPRSCERFRPRIRICW
jgi:hypothetical protein